MLGIIVVKLHNDFDFDNAKANVQIQQGNKKIYRNHMKIRPCPLKEKAIMSGNNLETIIGDTE